MARLMRLPGIGSIDIDHSGTLMRLRIADRDPDLVVDAVLAVLRLEGRAGTPLAGGDEERATSRIEAWLGSNAAVELSREEARTLAAEAAAAFIGERPLAAAAADRLRRTMGERLYASFTAPDAAAQAGTLVERAVPGILAESRTYLASGDAEALEAFLARWRSARRRSAS